MSFAGLVFHQVITYDVRNHETKKTPFDDGSGG